MHLVFQINYYMVWVLMLPGLLALIIRKYVNQKRSVKLKHPCSDVEREIAENETALENITNLTGSVQARGAYLGKNNLISDQILRKYEKWKKPLLEIQTEINHENEEL